MIKQLLPIGFSRNLTTIPAKVVEVDKDDIQDFLRFISKFKCFQMDELEHLKRIKRKTENDPSRLLAILCTRNAWDSGKVTAEIKDEVLNKYKDILEVGVPEFPAFTKEQFDSWRTVWPMIYKQTGQTIFNNFTSADETFVKSKLREAVDLAAEAKSLGNRGNACILVDPRTNTTVTYTLDNSSECPIYHCVMELMKAYNKLTHAAVTSKQPEENNNNNNLEENKEVFPSAESRLEKRPPEMKASELEAQLEPGQNYYCSNLDLYIAMEPCIMCAMALVHSRIRRVFYALQHQDAAFGGLNQLIQINNHQSLNHKYLVFTGVEEEYARMKLS